MPYVSSASGRIHYTVDGAGPAVVFQHGFLSSASAWRGFVDALKDKYLVACVDSLGHGLSDKPSHPENYTQKRRAADIVAVLDDLGEHSAHLVGYSMGAWMSVGVAKYCPERLSSLVIGGWDLVNGVATANASPDIGLDPVLARARAEAPQLVEWVRPEFAPALDACWRALGDLEGAAPAVLGLSVPVLLWNGRADPYHDPMRDFASANGLQFLSTSGGHLDAASVHGNEGIHGILEFLESAAEGSPIRGARANLQAGL